MSTYPPFKGEISGNIQHFRQVQWLWYSRKLISSIVYHILNYIHVNISRYILIFTCEIGILLKVWSN